MGRRKGDSYRKLNLKKYKRIAPPAWTIREDVLDAMRDMSKELKVSQSRFVEIAIKNMLSQQNKILINPQRIFTKS
jgi:hypothetical protein